MSDKTYQLKQKGADIQRAIDNALNPDKTLTVSGMPADAAEVGRRLKNAGSGGSGGGSFVEETGGTLGIFPGQSYHNLDHSPSIDIGGLYSEMLNGVGYAQGKELYEGRKVPYTDGYASDASEGTSADYDVTGYLPLTSGHTMRVYGMRFEGKYGGVAFYSSTTGVKGFIYMSDLIGSGVTNESGAGNYTYGCFFDDNGILNLEIPQIKINLSTGAATPTNFASYAFDHVRICCSTMSEAEWDDVIISVDEPITLPVKTLDPSVKVTTASMPDEIRILNRAAYTSGVFWDPEGTSMNAYVNGAMKVRIDPGVVMIDGVVKRFAATNRTYNTQATDRVNACVIRLDQSTGEIKMHFRECIEQGGLLVSVDDNAVLPIRNAKYYDIVICRMRIPGGTTQITSEMVYNMQNEEMYCGYVKSKTYGSGSSGGGSATKTINLDWADERQECYVDYISNDKLESVQFAMKDVIEAEGGIVKAYIGEDGYYSEGFLEMYNDGNGTVVLVAAKDGETIHLATPLIDEM